jgi:hypothetical protein
MAFDASWHEFEGLKDEYNRALGVATLAYYIERHDNLIPKYVEIGMAVELHNGWVYTGRIDLIAEFDSVIYVVDHKTRAKSLGTYCMNPNFQLIGYSYGVQQTLGLPDPKPIMVNLINVSTKGKSGDFNLRMTSHPTAVDVHHFLNTVNFYVEGIMRCTKMAVWPRLGMEYHCAWCEFREPCTSPHLIDRLVESGVFKVEEWKAYE